MSDLAKLELAIRVGLDVETPEYEPQDDGNAALDELIQRHNQLMRDVEAFRASTDRFAEREQQLREALVDIFNLAAAPGAGVQMAIQIERRAREALDWRTYDADTSL